MQALYQRRPQHSRQAGYIWDLGINKAMGKTKDEYVFPLRNTFTKIKMFLFFLSLPYLPTTNDNVLKT